MSSYRLRLELCYKDGTQRGMVIECPENVGLEIMNKGLIATRVFVDRYLSIPNAGIPEGLKIDTFHGDNNRVNPDKIINPNDYKLKFNRGV